MTSIIKVNNLQNQCGANTINKCGTTITLGASGDTIALASGASQTGFGRTGTVDWDTTPKTATFSAVSGEGYFLNTSGGVITANLPAGVAGAIVSFADYAETWQTYNVTVAPNGTDKIGSQNLNAVLSTQGQSVTFVFVDSTQGWINTMDSTSNVRGISPFVEATGGTITTVCTNYKVHTFTGPGTFTVTSAGTPAGSDTVDYLVIAGGGGGGGSPSGGAGGGGGAGGFRESSGTASGCYSASPLGACVSALPVSITGYPIIIGGGGGAPTGNPGADGSNSVFSTITSTGGGGGGEGDNDSPGGPGGSGGGVGNCAGACAPTGTATAGAGNTPPVSPSQGFSGGGVCAPGLDGDLAAGGGGATAVGQCATCISDGIGGGNGGAGATTSIIASPTAYAGGGGGGSNQAPLPIGAGGTGGGGNGGFPTSASTAGTTNTGGGGGGGGNAPNFAGAAGGSGIVIIRYKFQ